MPGNYFSPYPGCGCKSHFKQVLFGGDQLTVERIRSGMDVMCDSHNESQRFEGIMPTIEDWHAKQCFLK